MNDFKIFLLEKNIKQKDLVKLLGCSKMHVSLIVNGKRHPGPKYLAKLLKRLGLTEAAFNKLNQFIAKKK